MKEKLLSTVQYLKKHYRFVIAALILIFTGYTIYFDPPKIMRGADDYISKGDHYFENQNYEEALSYYRNAKYFVSDNFEIDFKIAQSLIQMPPQENSGYLVRYYLDEAAQNAKEIAELEKLLRTWQGKPDLETKFRNSGMPKGTMEKQIQQLKERLKQLKKIKKLECATFAACVEIAESAMKNNNFRMAEKYYVKAIHVDQSRHVKENLQNAMVQILILQFAQGEHCKPLSWEAAANKQADGSSNYEPLKKSLQRYAKFKEEANCMYTARSIGIRMMQDIKDGQIEPNEKTSQLLPSYKMAAQLMLTYNPKVSFGPFKKESDETNRQAVLESLTYLDELKEFQGAAYVYERAGKQIKNWPQLGDRNFKETASRYIEFARKLYLQEGDNNKALHLETLAKSLQ